MGIFDNFFTSPREREGKDLSGGLLDQINGMQSGFAGINNINDVGNKFGVEQFDLPGYQQQVGKTFAPARANLATRRGQALSSTAARMRGSNATPEMSFTPIEGQYANAFGNLEGQQADANLAGYDKQTAQDEYIANLLKSVMGSQDQYGLNKTQMKGDAISKYLQSLSGASTFDDILSVGDTAARFVKGGK